VSSPLETKNFNHICHLFERQVHRDPSAIAAIFEGHSLTYLELDQRSNQIAHYLRKNGIQAEIFVGLSLYNSLDLLVGILGILKAGGVYLPLDPNYPKERLRYMLDDAKPAFILGEHRTISLFEESACKVIQIKDASEMENTPCNVTLSRNQLAYVIYTSGSTGNPKGIAVEHDALSHAAIAHSDYYPTKPIALMSSGISFDPSLLILFHTLVSGGTICLPNQEEIADPESAIDLIERYAINFLLCVPSFYTMLLNKSRPMLSLKSVSLAGENISKSLPSLHARFASNAILYNEYGPSECAIGATIAKIYDPIEQKIYPITVGKPIPNTEIYLLNEELQPVPFGSQGEIFIAGKGLARGYLNREDLTAERFLKKMVCLYRTGDFGRFLPNGDLEFLGRMDNQVKIRGHRVELGEIERTACRYPEIDEAVSVVQEDKLVLYFSTINGKELTVTLKQYLNEQLPKPMVPSAFLQVKEWARTPNGKIDRANLPEIPRSRVEYSESLSPLEQKIFSIWKQVLKIEDFGIHDNFFDLGGDSLGLAEVQTLFHTQLGVSIGITELLQCPTVSSSAKFLSMGKIKKKSAQKKPSLMGNGIAIIGISGRFPGAENIDMFWKCLSEGRETLSTTSNIQSSQYVNKRGVLSEIEMFDASFFGMSEKEAEVIDPQQRLFLECAWEALESGGDSSENYSGSIGVYGGTSRSTYFLHHLLPHQKLMETLGDYLIRLGNEPDFLTTRVSYKLNLKGPSLAIQTACSTSLTAVCMACNHLLTYQCDMALAGGVSITLPQENGYKYQPEMIFSPDGACRPFDASAKGTVPSNGVGVVLLKRLEDAVADGDHIYAIIRGYGLNNDGSLKMGFSAPSVKGQKEAIQAAIAMADIDPATIGYIEAHGTGTILGDPIELTALTEAFSEKSVKPQFCAIGSLKSNMGHMMEAAGIAGLIKAALMLQQKQIPPTLHFTTPNPNIDFQKTPFYLNRELKEWKEDRHPRRAGVSSFGFGGTNAHVILEEAPKTAISESSESQLLILSAKTSAALKKMSLRLKNFLLENPHLSLADIAYTLQVGRKAFEVRRAFICRDLQEAIACLDRFENSPSEEGPLLKLKNAWLAGESIDWFLLHKEKRNRIPLPTYPFEKKRYWIDPPTKNDPEVKIKEGIQTTSLSSIEAILMEIWGEFLGSKSIGIEDDFFILGGDSLLAIQLLSAIEARCGITLSFNALYEHPTITQLATFITQCQGSLGSNLIKLKSGNDQKTLFFIHAIDGGIFSYKALVDVLSFEGTIFGIEANITEKNHQTIEEIAASYIVNIKKIQPIGPYSFFGASFGALIVYEMARQLKESGETVEWLGMLDVLHPEHDLIDWNDDLAAMAFLLELFEGKETPIEELKVLSTEEISKRLLSSIGLDAFPYSYQQKIYTQIIKHLEALKKYNPKPYEGEVVFFEVKNRFFRAKDISLGETWKRSVNGSLIIHKVSGDHLSAMKNPHAIDLAQRIDEVCFTDSSL